MNAGYTPRPVTIEQEIQTIERIYEAIGNVDIPFDEIFLEDADFAHLCAVQDNALADPVNVWDNLEPIEKIEIISKLARRIVSHPYYRIEIRRSIEYRDEQLDQDTPGDSDEWVKVGETQTTNIYRVPAGDWAETTDDPPETDEGTFDRVFGAGAREGLFDKLAEILEARPGEFSADDLDKLDNCSGGICPADLDEIEALEDLTDAAISAAAEEEWIGEQVAINSAETAAIDAHNLEALIAGTGTGICPITYHPFNDCNCPDCTETRLQQETLSDEEHTDEW